MPTRDPHTRLLGSALACCLGRLRQGQEEARPPNVLLISIDTLRADHVGCLRLRPTHDPQHRRSGPRGGPVREPHLELVVDAARPTRLCSRRSPTRCTVAWSPPAPRSRRHSPRWRNASRTRGTRRRGFYAGPYLHEVFGLGQGFETYRYCVEAEDQTAFSAEEVESWGLNPVAQQRSHEGITNPGVYRAGVEWMEANKGRPFFAFLHFWDVHYDFTPPSPWDTRFNPGYQGPVDGRGFVFDPSIAPSMPEADKQQLLALYDGEIGWTDTFVGRLREDLADWGLADDTIIVVTSDHGTEFFDHGGKGHRSTLYDELIRIPLVIWYPERLAPRRVSAQTRSIDVGPTLLELTGLPAPRRVMGYSLLPLASGGELDFDNAAISELYSVGRRLRSVRALESKFLVDENEPEPFRWYDLQLDRAEVRPIRDLNAELGGRAQERYLRAKAALDQAVEGRAGTAIDTNLTPEIERGLQEFGYAGDDPDDDPDEDSDDER